MTANTKQAEEGFSKIATIKEVLENNGNLSLPLYVKIANEAQQSSMKVILKSIHKSHKSLNESMDNLFTQLQELGIEK